MYADGEMYARDDFVLLLKTMQNADYSEMYAHRADVFRSEKCMLKMFAKLALQRL
jgi:hypothetical protein